MRIGIDVAPLTKEVAGIGQYVLNMIENLLRIDKENEYILYSYADVVLPFQLNERWKIVVYGNSKNSHEFITKLPKQIKRDHIDLFWGTRGYLPFGNMNVGFLISVHDLAPILFPEFFELKHRTLFKFLISIGIRKADKIMTISKSTQNDIINMYPIQTDNITVTYLGANPIFKPSIDGTSIKNIMDKYHIDSNYILCLSTVEPRKNMLRTIKAYHRGLKEKQISHKLVIVGGSGWKNNDVYDYVKDNNLETQVIFTGYTPIEDIKYIYNGASLFVYASLYEGFGIPILEAMQSGTPVITSNIASMPEVAGDACILVNPEDEDEILASMVSVLSSEKLQQDMIIKGLEQVDKFSWRKCAQESLEVIHGFRNL